jgi:2-polyprenyl-6-methoxyphenol hydroxylase-like FAD-dependent oxidoreductase
VSQIHMESWHKERVALIGDAAACPSLLAGQGSALAMAEAYVLAGELAASEGAPSAFGRYETLLRPLLTAKQKSAAQFAGGFAPKTKSGLFLRNQIMKTLTIPHLANLVIGPGLLDKVEIPDYPPATA